jgi:hypothetical protein
MSGLKENIVYAILFNGSSKNYSLNIITSTLELAFEYICKEEKAMFNSTKSYKLIQLNNQNEINFDYNDKCVNICYVSSGDYSNLNIWNRIDISQFIIVPMKVH